MKINKKEINRILLITLNNIGDIILTTPLISVLDREFPEARLDIMVGPLGKSIFKEHPRVYKVIIYNKHLPLQEKRRLIRKLKKIKYDLVVDLKNTLFPILIGSKYHTSPLRAAPNEIVHKKDFHLWKLRVIGIEPGDAPFSLYTTKGDRNYIDAMLQEIMEKKDFVAVSPASKSLIKRWRKSGFAKVCDRIMEELGLSIAMIGDHSDRPIIDDIIAEMKSEPYNFAGMTTLPQLAHLITRSRLLITNDSAPMHVGAAIGADVLAIFGPTDPRKYGPRGRNDRVIRKDIPCSPCEKAQCIFNHECMKFITADEVYEAAREILKI